MAAVVADYLKSITGEQSAMCVWSAWLFSSGESLVARQLVRSSNSVDSQVRKLGEAAIARVGPFVVNKCTRCAVVYYGIIRFP